MKYVNPHLGYNNPQFNQNQPNVVMTQQGPMMMTNQGLVPVYSPQFNQNQPNVVMTQQGSMMMTNQGLVPVYNPQFNQNQPNVVMTQQGPMMMTNQGLVPVYNPQFNQNQQFLNSQQVPVTLCENNQQSSVALSQNRFTQQHGVNNQMSQVQDSARYSSEKIEESNIPSLFSVKPNIHKLTNNNKFKLSVVTDLIDSSNVKFNNDVVSCDCLDEITEYALEEACKDDTVLNIGKYIISTIFYKTDMSNEFNDLLSNDIKHLYKTFKTIYSNLDNKYQLVVMDKLDNILVTAINDCLEVNSKYLITIDSFLTDFNDLLKVIRNNENNNDLEDSLIDYLNAYVVNIKESIANIKPTDNSFTLAEEVILAYIDKHILELGLNDISDKFIKLTREITNRFIISMTNEVISRSNSKEFILVTLDRSKFKFIVSNDNIYIKKL